MPTADRGAARPERTPASRGGPPVAFAAFALAAPALLRFALAAPALRRLALAAPALHRFTLAAPALAAFALAFVVSGCSAPPAVPRITVQWVIGRAQPTFDPDGPADPSRLALERLLSRGLLDQDASGRLVPAAAERYSVSPDGLTYTFTLREDLRFSDGSPCTSGDFRDALVAGLTRTDHSTRRWQLHFVRGVDAVRSGRPLPALGIESPSPHQLVLHLVRPDSLLPQKLALPGVATPWKNRLPATAWTDVRGVGPYRAAAGEPGRRLVLTRAPRNSWERAIAGPDTIVVRYLIGAPRVRAALRAGQADLVWPLPTALLEEPVPPAFREVERAAVPERRLLLVLRADVPPTTKLPARHALAHGLNRTELQRALGRGALEGTPWLDGAGEFELPRLGSDEVAKWLDLGHLGRSFHVTLAFDADGVGAEVARSMQGAWSRLNLYAELKPLRGAAALGEALAGQSQALLVESQPDLPGPVAEMADLVMPIRGPAVGTFRTGWRTREFDPWLVPTRAPSSPLDGVAAQARIEEELIALPLVRLPWRWIERPATERVRFHPRFGPEFTGWVTAQPVTR